MMYKFFITCLIGLLPCLAWGGEEVFLPYSTQIADKNGAPMRGFLSSEDTFAEPVPLSEVSPWLVAAAVAAEDKRFYSHGGVDSKAILRALWQNSQKGEVVSGASTITQQLVRSLRPRKKNWLGKTEEAWAAFAMEKDHTKEEILEAYFNRLELGNLTQGVQAASQFYFGIDAADLSLSQAAFLVGIIKSPTYYNPRKHYSRALKRRDYVLKRMEEEEFIDPQMRTLAQEEKIVLRGSERPFEAPHFTQMLRPLLPPDVSFVRSSLDKDLQVFAQELVKTHIQKLSEQQVTNAAVVVLDNETGAVLAYVGSADFYHQANQGQVDGVLALRQPGSALKPFVYATAFEKGILNPSSLLDDEDTFFQDGFRPRNYDKNFHGKITVRTALACSYNIPAAKAAETVGVPALLQKLHDVGLTELGRGPEFYGLGISLGNGEVQLLHLVNAYATLARGGMYKPILLAHEPLIQLPGKTQRVLSEQTSYLISHILKDNQARSAAFGLNSPLFVPFEMAAKTGTSKDYKDNFALGYTPRWTIGVWAGNFDASSMQKVSGITGAGPILHDLAIYLNEKYPSPPFKMPDGIVQELICSESGLRAGKTCQHTQEEIFAKEFLPPVCQGQHESGSSAVSILSPATGDVYKWDPASSASLQKLLWKATCAAPACTWKLNGKKQSQKSCQVWWPIKAGKYRLEVNCEGKTDTIFFEVLP